MEHATICHPTYKTCSHKAHEELRCLKQTMRWKTLLSLIKQSVILPLAGNILCMVFKIQKKGCDIATRGAARTFGQGLRRSTVAHFARKVRGTNIVADKHAKNPTKICPRALAIFATCSWPSLCKQSELQCWRRNRRLCGPAQISAARTLPLIFNISILNTLTNNICEPNFQKSHRR